MALTALKVKNAKPGRHTDGRGLVSVSEAERRADMVTAYAERRQATGLWAGIGYRRVASRSTGRRDSLAPKGAGRLRYGRRAAQGTQRRPEFLEGRAGMLRSNQGGRVEQEADQEGVKH